MGEEVAFDIKEFCVIDDGGNIGRREMRFLEFFSRTKGGNQRSK